MTRTRVVGEDRLRATLARAGVQLAGPGMAGAVARTQAVMVRAVRVVTPRRSGALAASVRPVAAPRLGAVVGSALSYAPPVEYGVPARRGLTGGHNIPAVRMFARGLAAGSGPAVDAVDDAVNRIMRNVKGA